VATPVRPPWPPKKDERGSGLSRFLRTSKDTPSSTRDTSAESKSPDPEPSQAPDQVEASPVELAETVAQAEPVADRSDEHRDQAPTAVAEPPRQAPQRAEEVAEADEPAAEETAAEASSHADAEPEASEPPVAETPAAAEKASPAFARDNYVSPLASKMKGRMVDVGRRRGGDKPSEGGREEPRRPQGQGPDRGKTNVRMPSVRVAPMPEAPKPKTPKAKADEPPAQKPEISLTIEQFSGKGGSAPLRDQVLKRAEEKHKADQEQKDKPATKGRDGASARPSRTRGPGEPAAATTPAAPGRGRPGVRGAKDEDDTLVKDGRIGRQKKRKKGAASRRRKDDEDGPVTGVSPIGGYTRNRTLQRRRSRASTAAPRKSDVVVDLPITVRALSEAVSLPAAKVLKKLLELNIMATVNTVIEEEDTVRLIASELGVDLVLRPPVDLEETLINDFDDVEDADEDLRPRPPVVTFLGHVDHGKTSLLDKIIGLKVASGESGGITQHIRAYNVPYGDASVTFVDTPGHEAFTEMRARGANATDIAVLVIAADDGFMPQTEEALSHARAAEVPIVVALNKIDLPGANPERVFQQMAERQLLPTEWGGDVEVVQTSAMTGEGLDELMETLLTIAELHALRANPDRPASGVCLEAEMQGDRGALAKILVQNGTLKAGDVILCGTSFGRVKTMYDTLKPRTVHKTAGPGVPVTLSGLDEAPAAGEPFYVLEDIAQAREIVEKRRAIAQLSSGMPINRPITLEDFSDRLAMDSVRTLNLIVRADTRGSLEAIKKELAKLEHPEVAIRILQEMVGGITEADVTLADVTDAVILGFNVVPDERAKAAARGKGVQIREYGIIYKLTDDVRKALEQRLKPGQQVVELGVAIVLQLFVISRVGTIAGCRVASGTIERNCRVKIVRDNRVIGDYQLESLRREKDDAKEVRAGYECGIKIHNFNDLKEGDTLHAYKIEQVARTLDDV
jgi:translation initiation factor IF-2